MKSRRDGAVHTLECLQNKEVKVGAGLDVMEKRHINEVDKE